MAFKGCYSLCAIIISVALLCCSVFTIYSNNFSGMDSFYVTLPSNVLSDDESFPNNSVAHYKTRLSMPILLSGRYEVALKEISYTFSWFNLPQDEYVRIAHNGSFDEVIIEAGRYESIEDLVFVINNIFASFGSIIPKTPRLHVDKYTKKVMLRQDDDFAGSIFFSENLSGILGFGDLLSDTVQYSSVQNMSIASRSREPRTPSVGKTVLAKQAYDITGGLHSLYVYSDVVNPSHVGNSFVPLLRVVNVKENKDFGQQIVEIFSNPNYLPVRSNCLTVIEIDCKDDTGHAFPFEFGRTIVTLHFRKKSI